jgi:hypothetical protein
LTATSQTFRSGHCDCFLPKWVERSAPWFHGVIPEAPGAGSRGRALARRHRAGKWPAEGAGKVRGPHRWERCKNECRAQAHGQHQEDNPADREGRGFSLLPLRVAIGRYVDAAAAGGRLDARLLLPRVLSLLFAHHPRGHKRQSADKHQRQGGRVGAVCGGRSLARNKAARPRPAAGGVSPH